MYNGIGLQTPRGSGTSGYVEKSKIPGKIKEEGKTEVAKPKKDLITKSLQDYDAKRKIELECYRLKKKLIAAKESEEKINEAVEQLRQKLISKETQSATATKSDSNTVKV